jgi:hypothetical protein
MKGLMVFLAAAGVLCGFLYWWSSRLDRCLAREGYWYWSGTRYGLNGACKRSAGPTFDLDDR